MPTTGNTRLLERLVANSLLSPEQQEATLSYVQRTGERVEDALLELGHVDEADLLKFLATLHKTRFVSTEKLGKADIDHFTLERVPQELAERELLFPVLFDAEANVLSVVTPDPDNAPALHEAQIAAGAKEVRAYVGRPGAVRAAIAKAYHGDIHAFASLDRVAQEQFTTMLDVFERNVLSEESLTSAIAASEASTRDRMISPEELEHGPTGAGTVTLASGVASSAYLETLNVLVSLLENSRADLRGHSAQVARLMRKVAERIGLSEVEQNGLMIAAYVHDLGKMGAYHLTALNVSEYEGHRVTATKVSKTPARLLEAVGLPHEVLQMVSSMYERFDGSGFPDGESGKEIPLGARLLAIADTYADLTQNPKNPFRKSLRPFEACEVLARYRGTVFDGNLVDLFKNTVTGDDLRSRLLADRYHALIIDPDPEETTVLELRLLEQGFDVTQAHSSEQAMKILSRGEVEVVISEIDLKPQDGLTLLSEVRRSDWGQALPWVVVSGRAGRSEAQRAFQLGVVDFMTKPVAPEVLVAKLKQILERAKTTSAKRGVSGSLAEMGLPDMVQVLWHGRKTGSLKIRSGAESGEIHFVEGAIYNALWASLRGEEAFYAMLGLRDGEFALDPNHRAPQQLMSDSPEALLLEGMRRLDESSR